MIEFAAHTWSFHDLTLSEALGTTARMGFRRVDIGIGKAPADARRAAAEIADDLRRYHLQISDLYLMLPRISLPKQSPDHQPDLETFAALLPLAVELGAPGITLSPGVIQTDANAFTRTAAALRSMVAAAGDQKLRVSIEPHVDSMAASPDAALQFVDAVPGLEITLDWAQMVYANVAPEAIRSLLPKTRHVQIRQAARGHLQAPFEKGKINLAQVIDDLHAAEYDGTICIELVNTAGRYGISAVNAVSESIHLRDALRDARDRR